MNNDSNYGLLLNAKDIKLHRRYFKEMCKLIGIKVIYRAPRPDKHYTTYAEIDSNYEAPMAVGCIFEEHPQQQTLKKLGWISELQEGASIIHVDYDLPNLQQGALFIIPSGLDNAEGRLFRVSRLTNGIIAPATMACEIVPEYKDTFTNAQFEYKHKSFNLLNEEDN